MNSPFVVRRPVDLRRSIPEMVTTIQSAGFEFVDLVWEIGELIGIVTYQWREPSGGISYREATSDAQ